MTRRILILILTALMTPSYMLAQAPRRNAGAAASAAAPVRFVLAPTGNEAHFVAREQLIANTIENDAIGITTAITGAVVLDAHGKVDPTQSRFTVQLDSLKSDKAMRDRYIKGRTIETGRFPTAELVIKDLPGLPATLPTSGTVTFKLTGDLTIHGVTKPSTWDVTATADANGLTGTATTVFTFESFNMTQPSVPVLASVHDNIKLEYDFHLVRADAK